MKKIIIKILVSFFSIALIIYSIISIIDCIQRISYIENSMIFYNIKKGTYLGIEIYRLVFYVITITSNILLFLLVNIKDLDYLTSSLIKAIKEHRASTAEQRKAKKQAKLQAEIAEKQAKLDEIKKDVTE